MATNTATTTRIGFVGLGNMGGNMAARFLARHARRALSQGGQLITNGERLASATTRWTLAHARCPHALRKQTQLSGIPR